MEPAVAGALYTAETLVEGAAALVRGLIYPTQPLRATFSRIDSLPAPRVNHTVSVVKGRAYVFGGETGSGASAGNSMTVIILPSSAVHEADYKVVPARPEEKDGPLPAPRKGHTADVIGDEIFVFGGELLGHSEKDGHEQEPDGIVWVFNTFNNTWRLIKPPVTSPLPPPRTNHSAAASEEPGPRHVVTHTEVLPQQPADPAEVVPEPPRPGSFGTLFVHSGRATSSADPAAKKGKAKASESDDTQKTEAEGLTPTLLNDFWALDIRTSSWTLLPPAPGSAREGAALAVVGRRAYRFGGADEKGFLGGRGVDWVDVSGVLYGKESHEWSPNIGVDWESVPFAPGTAGSGKANEEDSDDYGETPARPGSRRGAFLEPVTTGQGRQYLLLVGGEELDGASPRYAPEVWGLQLPSEPGASAAKAKDKTKAAAGRKTGEAQWAEVQYKYIDAHGDEVETSQDGKGIGRRGAVAVCRGSEVDGATIFVWGGIGVDGKVKDDGYLVSVDR